MLSTKVIFKFFLLVVCSLIFFKDSYGPKIRSYTELKKLAPTAKKSEEEALVLKQFNHFFKDELSLRILLEEQERDSFFSIARSEILARKECASNRLKFLQKQAIQQGESLGQIFVSICSNLVSQGLDNSSLLEKNLAKACMDAYERYKKEQTPFLVQKISAVYYVLMQEINSFHLPNVSINPLSNAPQVELSSDIKREDFLKNYFLSLHAKELESRFGDFAIVLASAILYGYFFVVFSYFSQESTYGWLDFSSSANFYRVQCLCFAIFRAFWSSFCISGYGLFIRGLYYNNKAYDAAFLQSLEDKLNQ